MSAQYLYNVEFTVDDFDLWTYPEDLQNPDDLPTTVRFTMAKAEVCLEIGEEEFIDQVNCDKKFVKNAMFSLSSSDLKNEIEGKIEVFKIKCPGEEEMIGVYKFPQFKNNFVKLVDEYDKLAAKKDEKPAGNNKCTNRPSFEIIKELVQLSNNQCQPCGSLFYTLRLTCFGPSITNGEKTEDSKCKEASCLERSTIPSPCQTKSPVKQSEFDEYAAEINGNQLIIRVHKEDKSYLVTRVFDEGIDQEGNEIPRNNNVVSICGCEQQVDFKFPSGDCKKKPKCDSILTDHQRKTSCVGSSFKNSKGLPVIRGNLKYPGRLDGSIKLDVYDKCEPRDATEKYKMKPMSSRGACCQVDCENLNRELEEKCKIPQGIEVCKKGCDKDSDVFILKIGRKNTDKKGRQNAIELEMRTPKGPDNEVKKKETREVQVDESEFDDKKKKPEKKTEAPPKKGIVKKPEAKKTEVKPTKGFTSKKK